MRNNWTILIEKRGILFLVLILLNSAICFAQPTSGSSTYYSQSQMQQARETAEMNRHYESMRPSSGSASGNNIRPYDYKTNTGTPMNPNEYYKRQLHYTTDGEIAAMNAKARREYAIKQKEKDDKDWKNKISDFKSWQEAGLDETLPLSIRIANFEKAYNFAAGMNSRTKASWKGPGAAPQADLSNLRLNLGVLLARNGQYEAALEHILNGGGTLKGMGAKLFSIQRSWLGFTYLMLNNYNEAIYRYKELMTASRAHTPALCYAYYLNKQPDLGISLINEYLAKPDTGSTRYFIEKLNYYKMAILLTGNRQDEAMGLYNSLGYPKLKPGTNLNEQVVVQLSNYIADEMTNGVAGASILFKLDLQKKLSPKNIDILYSSYFANRQLFRQAAMQEDRQKIEQLGGNIDALIKEIEAEQAALQKQQQAESLTEKPGIKRTARLESALGQVNDFVKNIKGGYYGYFEIVGDTLYERLQSGKYAKAPISSLSHAKTYSAGLEVLLYCDNEFRCVYSDNTNSYRSFISIYQPESFNTEELVVLFNRLINTFKEDNGMAVSPKSQVK